MAKIDVYMSEMSSLSSRLKQISSLVEDAEQITSRVQSNLDLQVAAREDIASGLSRVKGSLRKQKDKVRNLSNVTTVSEGEFRKADNQMDKKTYVAINKISTPLSNRTYGAKSLFVGMVLARYRKISDLFMPEGTIIRIVGLGAMIRKLMEIMRKWKEHPITPVAPNPTSKEDEEKRQKEKDQKELDIINARYKTLPGANKGFTGKCGAFVFQQLMAQGIVTKTGVNESTGCAKDYARVLAKKKATSTGYKVTNYGEGDNAFDNFLAATKGKSPLTNIVCSFKKGTTTGNEKYGHAMLISKIENGKVYYVDNRVECRQKDNSYAARCITIDEFKKIYFKAGNNCTGITQLG